MACNVYSMMLLNAHNCFKTQEVCNKTVEDDPRMLQFIIDCCETQQKCEKAVDSYLSPLECVLDCFVTLEMFEDLADFEVTSLIILVLINLLLCVIDINKKKRIKRD